MSLSVAPLLTILGAILLLPDLQRRDSERRSWQTSDAKLCVLWQWKGGLRGVLSST